MNYTAEQIEIISAIAARQDGHETWEHIVASEAARYQAGLHREDGQGVPGDSDAGDWFYGEQSNCEGM